MSPSGMRRVSFQNPLARECYVGLQMTFGRSPIRESSSHSDARRSSTRSGIGNVIVSASLRKKFNLGCDLLCSLDPAPGKVLDRHAPHIDRLQSGLRTPGVLR